jgi:hypothetical protein
MRKKRIIIGASISLTVIIAVWLFAYVNDTRSVLPSSVTKNVNYDIFVPRDTEKYPVLEESVTHNTDTKVLSYATTVNNKQVTINQQAEPDTFNAPELKVSLYQKLLDKMNQYKEIKTDAGTVTLTHPTELNGGQAAVLDTKGTLLFAQPTVALSDDEWRDFFNDLKAQ